MANSLPGTFQHQQMLQTIIDYYAHDSRILAILLFGSLGRGNWDTYSDLDLDIVMQDDVLIDAAVELAQLCDAIEKKHALDTIIIADSEEGDVVLSNLLEFSIRYHPLLDTKPAILDTMILLAGTLSIEAIRDAGEINRNEYRANLDEIVNQCIRYALEIHNAVTRERFWMASELLYRSRVLLMQLFTVTHGGIRTIHFFETNADLKLQEQFKQSLATG